MSMGFFSLLFIFNLMDPGASLRYYKQPDWLASMSQPALQRMCLNRSAAMDKRLLAAAALRLRYKNESDFRLLAGQVNNPVLKRDLLTAAGEKTGTEPRFGPNGIPADVLALPADTKAVLYFSSHLKKKDDIPEASILQLLPPFNNHSEMRYFNSFRHMSWLRSDSITIGLAGETPDNKSGPVKLTAIAVFRGTFDTDAIRTVLNKAKSGTLTRDGNFYYNHKKIIINFHDKNTIVAAIGLYPDTTLDRLASLKKALHGNSRPLAESKMGQLVEKTFQGRPFLSLTMMSEKLIKKWMLQDAKINKYGILVKTRAFRIRLYNASTSRFNFEGIFRSSDQLQNAKKSVQKFLARQQELTGKMITRAGSHAERFQLPQFRNFFKGIKQESEGMTLSISATSPMNINNALFLTLSGTYLPMMIRSHKRILQKKNGR